ncbi:ABC transporter permease [Candidatus Nitrosacidococcus sp. I8]|uniref:ABC transporter permease n=1 Tax=Candidatus Nitrosacidococcus sp. I8 TaxID=2942908 RepID=UPI0022270B59|nr:ABC transporter permease [Candidatus Nitrosacidococcus sp. I8]CAH9014861.1 Polysialic acid transport protein KpsM [Candidatus Nitrosacidococcus sp. I8]
MIIPLIFQSRSIFYQLWLREIKNRYLGSISGYLWVLFQPIAQLALYALVFATIFKVRFPELAQHSFVEFVAIALWPWLAFQEGIQRALGAITNHAHVLKKVALAPELLIYSTVGGSYAVHGTGFLFILAILTIFGAHIHLLMLPWVLLLLGLWLLFTLGLAFILAALQVFFRDMEHILASVLMLLFYASPILYPISLVPEPFHTLLLLNPLSYFFDHLRELLLFGEMSFSVIDGVAVLLSAALFAVGLWFFRRCAHQFEAFL